MTSPWQPTASLAQLQQRAAQLQKIRHFFQQRSILEVETPLLSKSAAPDLHLDSLSCGQYWLHTSPEYPMKRLLCAGYGDIYQICKVFRADESGRRHNPEFTMLEWYRVGWTMTDLMSEVAELIQTIAGTCNVIHLDYRDAVSNACQLDPFSASDTELQQLASQHSGMDCDSEDRDTCLDLIMTHLVEPSLAPDSLTFIQYYPASQAALAQKTVRNGQPVAERFEAYLGGLELANGYHELANAEEQRARFQMENQQRQAAGKHIMPLDEAFLAALEQGMPDCCGVALGVDRLIMLATGADHIDQVIAFPFNRA
jgi:lysyl-tRNA synthetase class 2